MLKKIKTKTYPFQSVGAIAMRNEIAIFCATFQKVAPTFSPANKPYKIAAKYLHGEDLFHVATCAYVRAYYPNVSIMHPKNEGKEGHTGQAKKKLMGVLEGASDLLLQCAGLPDFWLELKRKPNKPTKEQAAFLAYQSKLGKTVGVAYTLQDVAGLISGWAKNI